MQDERELTQTERARAEQQKGMRTLSEKKTYGWLPASMKKCVERNVPVAYKGHHAYFPDMLFRDAGFLVEIDGAYHRQPKTKRKDTKRDRVFRKHGLCTIRICNEDTGIDVAFWERLLEGMESISNQRSNALLSTFINDLRLLRDRTIRSWTQIETCDSPDGQSLFPQTDWLAL